MTGIVDEIEAVFEEHGRARYSESVSQLEHALQCAQLAEQEDGRPALIAAALLHDIGHMLHKFGNNPAERGIDDRHEDIGAGWLERYFGTDVSEPVRLHVDAKRYLCAVSPEYNDTLSPASVRSLALQGGPLRGEEISEFASGGYADDAVALRRWDDRAKVRDLKTPGFVHFRPILEAVRGRPVGYLAARSALPRAQADIDPAHGRLRRSGV